METFNDINYHLGNLIGLTLFDPLHFISLLMRFVVNLVTVCIIARCFYYPRGRRRDYMFIYILMSMSIFLLVSLMEGDGMNIGAAMGLFAIFGIMRFRTEAVPIPLSVVNALCRAEYHPKADYWDGFGVVTIVFVNLVFVGMAWIFESGKLVSSNCSKFIKYDNVALVAPDKRAELIADLEKRTGLKIERVEVGTIDFLKDACLIRIYYDEPADHGNSIEEITKMPRI